MPLVGPFLTADDALAACASQSSFSGSGSVPSVSSSSASNSGSSSSSNSSSSSGSGSSSASDSASSLSGSAFGCCSGVASTLTAVVTGACAVANGTYTLTYNATQLYWEYNGGGSGVVTIHFSCPDPITSFIFVVAGNCSPTPLGFTGTGHVSSCHPFYWSGTANGTDLGCCFGAINIVVTE